MSRHRSRRRTPLARQTSPSRSGRSGRRSESRLGDGWNLEGRGRGSEESAPAADSSPAPADAPPADELEQDVEEDTEYASELAQDYAREAWLEQAAEWFETGEDPAEIAQYLLENVGAEAAGAFYQVWKEEEQSEEEPVTADGWVWQQQANARAYEEAQQAELRRQNVLRALDEVTGMYGKTYVAKHDNLAALLMGVRQQDPAYEPPLTQREAQVEIRTALGEAEYLESVARAAELKMNFHKHTARSRGVGWMDGLEAGYLRVCRSVRRHTTARVVDPERDRGAAGGGAWGEASRIACRGGDTDPRLVRERCAGSVSEGCR